MLQKKEVALTKIELNSLIARYKHLVECCEDEIVDAKANKERYLKRIEELAEVWKEYI